MWRGRWCVALSLALAVVGCEKSSPATQGAAKGSSPPSSETPRATDELVPSDELQYERDAMVRDQIRARGIDDVRVLDAMLTVPRHRFVPDQVRKRAYHDRPLPIGHDVTISQPYIVAVMSLYAEVEPGDKVLEVGTGSGYQAAVLAELGAEVFSIEIIEPLHHRARADLDAAGYEAVHLRAGDGYAGWPEAAPFDAIILTAAPPEVPQPLLEQLAEDGRFVAPVGPAGGVQDLLVVRRHGNDFIKEIKEPVRFVPMTGRAQD